MLDPFGDVLILRFLAVQLDVEAHLLVESAKRSASS
jgi:hypothetical protein